MRALKNLISREAKYSTYEYNTVYISQHSKRRTLKVYRKDTLLEKHPIPAGVRFRKDLMERSVGLVRFELLLRRPQLADTGLDSPLAWTPTTLEGLLTPWIDKLVGSGAVLPSLANIEQLPPLLKAKLQLWLLEVESAFDEGNWTKATYQKHRRTIRTVTGVDIEVPLRPSQQRRALVTIRDLFAEGLRYKDYPNKWGLLTGSHQ